MGEGDFRPSTARRPLDRFSWNLKYITTSRTRPRMQNFRGLCQRRWSGQIASLTHESFCPFFFLSSSRPQVAFLDTSQHSICHYTSFPPRLINIEIGTYLQDVLLVTWPNLVKVGQRSKSYGYIICQMSTELSDSNIRLVWILAVKTISI